VPAPHTIRNESERVNTINLVSLNPGDRVSSPIGEGTVLVAHTQGVVAVQWEPTGVVAFHFSTDLVPARVPAQEAAS
jgi:hypothetical protein